MDHDNDAKIREIKATIDEREKRDNDRFAALERSFAAGMAAQEKLINTLFAASDKAITKAEDAQREYNVRSNEFRGQLDDQAKNLMARPEALGMFRASDDKLEAFKASNEKITDALAKEIAGLRESRVEGGGEKAGRKEGVNAVVVVLGIISTILGIALVMVTLGSKLSR